MRQQRSTAIRIRRLRSLRKVIERRGLSIQKGMHGVQREQRYRSLCCVFVWSRLCQYSRMAELDNRGSRLSMSRAKVREQLDEVDDVFL